jgi:allophanate hydrolase subunit 2
VAVDIVLGSRSQDSRSGLGPSPITAGTALPIGPDPGMPVIVDQAPPGARAGPVGVWPGPRVDWFVAGSLELLTSSTWTMSDQVSRVGARLDGPALERAVGGELPSEGVLTGAVQVPPDGRPVVMLADHPTTGGYPVVAVVDIASLPIVVQSRPGTTLRFRLLR